VINPLNLFKEEALVDLSLGLGEPLERFLRCAVLRAFVPSFMPPGATEKVRSGAYHVAVSAIFESC
jgi:hypothetical protein